MVPLAGRKEASAAAFIVLNINANRCGQRKPPAAAGARI
jgi:hypothetical protein